MRNERPEEDQNPTLIRELATIRFNYYLTTFKEVFNDVVEERRHILKEEWSKMEGDRAKLFSAQGSIQKLNTDELRKSTSIAVLKERFGAKTAKRTRDFTTSVVSSGSVASLNAKTIMLTDSD